MGSEFNVGGVPSFGVREAGRAYPDRPGAYAILVQRDLLVCVRTPTGLYLPGGGIDPGEKMDEALARECREEAGVAVEIAGPLCHARQLVIDGNGQGWDKDCHYFLARAISDGGRPTEPDHEPVHVAAEAAREQLKLEADRWAVAQYLAPRP